MNHNGTGDKMKRLGKHHHEDLTGEHRLGDLGQLIFLFIFLTVWTTDSFIIHYSDNLSGLIPLLIRLPLAVICLVASVYLARKGLSLVFGEIHHQPAVIQKGVFGIVRHPIYLGCLMFYLGLWILTFSLISILIWIIITVFYYIISRHEEKLLLKRFGKDYDDYMNEVPMLIPGIVKRN